MSRLVEGGLHLVEGHTWRPPLRVDTQLWYVPHQCVPREGKDTLLEPSGHPVALTGQREFWLAEGSEYTFPLNMSVYHDVEPVWGNKPMVITYVRGIPNIGNERELPTVLVPEGATPDNSFNRYGFDDVARIVYEDAVNTLTMKMEGWVDA